MFHPCKISVIYVLLTSVLKSCFSVQAVSLKIAEQYQLHITVAVAWETFPDMNGRCISLHAMVYFVFLVVSIIDFKCEHPSCTNKALPHAERILRNVTASGSMPACCIASKYHRADS